MQREATAPEQEVRWEAGRALAGEHFAAPQQREALK